MESKKRKRLTIITFILILILILLCFFGCKKCSNYKNNQILSSLPRINSDGYWVNKDNKKITDKSSKYRNINLYDYYKEFDSNYNKSYSQFYDDFNKNNLDYIFKVEFLNENLSIYKVDEYKLLNKLKFPENPNKDGCIFKGWQLLDDINNDLVFTNLNNVLVDNHLKFKPIFIKDTPPYKEYLDVKLFVDGKLYQEYKVKHGDKINIVEAPVKSNYLFLGWYNQFNNLFNPDEEIKIDLILNAKYFNLKIYDDATKKHNVNFYDEFGNIYQSIKVVNLDKVSSIPGKNKVGYHFVKWLEKDSLIPFDFDTQIIKDVDLIPVYEINKYLVQFTGEGIINLPGSFIDVPHGTILAEPDITTMNKVGYHFMNKYLDQDGNEFKFGVTPVIKDLTLTPVFEINRYTVSFDTTQGINNLPSDITNIAHGSTIAEPTHTMSKVGYHFMNKYLDQDGNEFKFGVTPVIKDLTLTPVFEINKYTVSFDTTQGINNLPSNITNVTHGSTITEPTHTMNKVGYHFMNKYLDQDGNEFKFGVTPVTKNLTLTPVFEINKYKIKFNTSPDYLNIPSTITGVEHGSKVSKPAGYNLQCVDPGYEIKGLYYFEGTVKKEFKFNETIVEHDIDITIEKQLKRHRVYIYDHNNHLIKSEIYNHYDIVDLKKYTNDYVYEYYYNNSNPSEKYFNDNGDVDNFKYEVTKEIVLKPKGHEKFIEFIYTDSDIKLIKANNELISGNKINVVTGNPINLPKVKKEHYYRVKPVVWQEDIGGTKQDYNETIYSYKFDTKLYLKDELILFEDYYLYNVNSDSIDITGLNSKYKNVIDFDLNIPQYIDDKEVKTISGFNNLIYIRNVTLPTSVIEIKDNCFKQSSIANINLYTSKVKKIGANAFMQCANLINVKLNNEIIEIGSSSFYGCPNLTTIDLFETGLTKIPDFACGYCDNLVTVKLPNSIKFIGKSSFQNNRKIVNLNIKDTQVEEIGDNAFYWCEKLPEIILPNTCRKLGNSCFGYPSSATKIDLSSTLIETIPYKCFEKCYEAKDILLPINVKKIESFAFDSCRKLNNFNISSTTVEEIGDNAFYWCEKLPEIILPNTCRKLGNSCFGYATVATKIDLSSTLIETIPYKCFEKCYEAKDILLSINVKKIESFAFDSCRKLNNFNISSTTVEEIGDNAFYWCEKLPEIILPNTCKKLGDSCFGYASVATKIDLLNTNIKTIPTQAFVHCDNVKEIKLPSTVLNIEEKAFSDCYSLDKIIYNGTKQGFKDITKHANWLPFISTINPYLEFLAEPSESCNYNNLS
ncbi:MAG: leucine-rich repeat protein [Bacillales bacterium]